MNLRDGQMRIGILGATGYSGIVLYSLLRQHPQVTQIKLYGHQGNNESAALFNERVPAFKTENYPIEAFSANQVMQETDCLFCATPAGVTSQLIEPFIKNNFPVIDLSGDFRLKDPTSYEKWYHRPAAKQEQLTHAEYGLAEFHHSISGHYIANPGCYATATLLGLAPLLLEHLIDLQSIIVDAKSGVSGSGKKLSASSHFTFINENISLYKLNAHQHIPEIMQQLKLWDPAVKPIQFSTTLIPVTRGLMATIYVKLRSGVTRRQVTAAFQAQYQNSPFVRWRNQQLPDLKAVVGSNFCDIGYGYNPAANVLTVVSVIDNLVKGAAGQAVQNFNLMWGFPEETGLPQFPVFP
ncbi:N-acetyl-gamma-glutamyl-phosphate reductase [Liquorilactobacillus vini DSM 20605]|uniref:N-acetyl-gamma-glutamyl-phosphate reductase n=2 Tax=Liquorilactobacillus vini TaxID=238015 RepID=A0A0R2CMC4_9LACO|nr:N-acetyl-gamma-glutamyl-phosphate reductase [Liquorilactobacillus vini DSM 20605]